MHINRIAMPVRDLAHPHALFEAIPLVCFYKISFLTNHAPNEHPSRFSALPLQGAGGRTRGRGVHLLV